MERKGKEHFIVYLEHVARPSGVGFCPSSRLPPVARRCCALVASLALLVGCAPTEEVVNSPATVEVAAADDLEASVDTALPPSQTEATYPACVRKVRDAVRLEKAPGFSSYRRGLVAERAGDLDGALRAYAEVFRNKPSTEVALLAWVGQGEVHHQKKDLLQAEKLFAMAGESLDASGRRFYAALRLAELRAELQGPEVALSTLEPVALQIQRWKDPCASPFRHAALSGLVAAYAGSRRPEHAIVYLHRVSGEAPDTWDETRSLALDLANEYAKQGRSEDATMTLLSVLMGFDPSPTLCDRIIAVAAKVTRNDSTAKLEDTLSGHCR